jgi:hypothetical protein
VQAAIDEGRRCSVDDTFECGDVPFGRQRDQSRALPQDGQVLVLMLVTSSVSNATSFSRPCRLGDA